ncbi:MAG TPA: 30S ribosomal protein S6 [Acidimicrobiia bacterium]|jgi:small subunit ribosomal protein S6
MRDYEVMTIHRPDLAEDEVESKVVELESHLSGQGASVEGRDIWGKRRFAYEIDHLSEGYYSVVTFKAEAAAVDSLDRLLSLADEVIRHKIVRIGV